MIPVKWPDVTLLAMTYLKSKLPGVTVTRTKRDGDVRQVVVASEFQQLETPISRRVTILMEAWGSSAADSVELMNDAMFALQESPQSLSNVARFDQPVGPSIEKDEAKVEYAEGSIVLVITA